MVEVRLARKVCEDISIALRPGWSLVDRAEQHEPLDAEPALYRNKVRRQQFYDPILFPMMKIVPFDRTIRVKNYAARLTIRHAR